MNIETSLKGQKTWHYILGSLYIVIIICQLLMLIYNHRTQTRNIFHENFNKIKKMCKLKMFFETKARSLSVQKSKIEFTWKALICI